MSEQNIPAKKKIYKRWWFWVLAVVILFILIGSSGSKKPAQNSSVATSTSTPAQTAMSVSAAQLASDYQANEVAADAKYKGKLLQVTGTVDSINKDIFNKPYVVLSGGSSNIFANVQCSFSQSDETKLATLSKGQQITVQGTDTGMTVESVFLEGCKIQ